MCNFGSLLECRCLWVLRWGCGYEGGYQKGVQHSGHSGRGSGGVWLNSLFWIIGEEAIVVVPSAPTTSFSQSLSRTRSLHSSSSPSWSSSQRRLQSSKGNFIEPKNQPATRRVRAVHFPHQVVGPTNANLSSWATYFTKYSLAPFFSSVGQSFS